MEAVRPRTSPAGGKRRKRSCNLPCVGKHQKTAHIRDADAFAVKFHLEQVFGNGLTVDAAVGRDGSVFLSAEGALKGTPIDLHADHEGIASSSHGLENLGILPGNASARQTAGYQQSQSEGPRTFSAAHAPCNQGAEAGLRGWSKSSPLNPSA